MGNWSRFVRPGFVRVDATPTPQDSVYLTAFVDPAGTRVVLVAINQLANERSQDFVIAGGTVAQLVPWVTATGQNLQAQAAVPVVGRRVHVRVARALGDDVRRRRHSLI